MARVCWDALVGRPDTGFLAGGGECGIARRRAASELLLKHQSSWAPNSAVLVVSSVELALPLPRPW